MSKLRFSPLLIVIPALALAATLYTVMFAGGSAGGTLSTGRSIMAHSDSIYLSSTFSADSATIETAGKTILVRPTFLAIDGMTVATIEKDVAEVHVYVKRGVVTFVADGKTIETQMR